MSLRPGDWARPRFAASHCEGVALKILAVDPAREEVDVEWRDGLGAVRIASMSVDLIVYDSKLTEAMRRVLAPRNGRVIARPVKVRAA